MRPACSMAPSDAAMAWPLGSRKLRAWPSATSMMSPRLPRPARSLRRITFMSGLLVLGLVGGALDALDLIGEFLVGAGGVDVVVHRLVATTATVATAVTATVATAAAGAGGGDALGVRQQGHLTRDLDRIGDLTLLLQRVAGDATIADLGAVAHEPLQEVDVLVVDVLDLLDDEDARLLLELAGIEIPGGPGLVLLACHRGGFLESETDRSTAARMRRGRHGGQNGSSSP